MIYPLCAMLSTPVLIVYGIASLPPDVRDVW